QADVPAFVVSQKLRSDLFGSLGLDRDIAVGTHLCAQFDIQQAQKVVNLGHGGHRRLSAAATGALLDGHGGRNAVNCVDVGLAGGLDYRSCVGVERFQISPLTLIEQYVKREC